MFNHATTLESLVRNKDKDIERLTYMNRYLTKAEKMRDDIILENQKEIQRLKQLLILYQKKVSENPKKDSKDPIQNLYSEENHMPTQNSRRALNNSSHEDRKRLERSRAASNSHMAPKNQKSESKVSQNRVIKPMGRKT